MKMKKIQNNSTINEEQLQKNLRVVTATNKMVGEKIPPNLNS